MQYPAFNGAQYIDIKKTVKCVGSRFFLTEADASSMFVGINDFCDYLGNCSIKHSTLTGLDADDHTQYWIGDGSRASDYLQFNTSLTPTTSVEGRVHWDDDSGTMEVDLPGGNVKLQVGQEGLVRVRNESGSDISNGLMVYTTGSSGNKPTVAHADNTDADKIHLLGMATEDIVHNANGYVALWGNVSGDMTQPINTLAYAEGTKLYLDTSGTWTDTHPPLPLNAVVIIGEVMRQHASEGKIMLLPRYFTLGNNYNGTLRQSIINKSTGNAAGASFTVVNDQGYRASLSIFGNSHAALSNVAGLYNSGYGDTAYVTDGNKDHVWYTDPSDLHNFNSLNFERMRLEADGTLTVGTPNYEDLVTADNDIPNKKFADENYVGRDLVNGTFQESFNCLAEGFGTSRLIAYLEKSGGGDLTMQFSDGNFPLDCTPSNSVVLTSGTPTVPQTNYVYVLQSTKALTVSTSDWPATEHIKVSFFLVLDPAYADGALINQNWNDHLMGTDNMGHLAHMAERSRRLGAIWHSGVTGAGGDDYTTSAAGTVYYKSNSGVLYQMHKHNYGAKDTDPAGANDNLHIVNHDTTPYYEVHNLYDATNDAAGGTLTNKYFNVVFWGVANKGGQYSPIMMNLPTGSYNNIDDAEGDVDGYDVYTIPHSFAQDSSTGFLIARHTFRKTGGTWAYQSGVDLRGTTPSTVTGGASGATQTEFSDNQFAIFDGADNTRIINFVADNITTSNTRLITMADWDVDLADISNIAADVSNNYATNVEVSNLGIASAAAYALKTDVSNNYETIVNVTALRTDVSNNYGTQVDVDSRALKTDVSNNYETIVNVTALRTDVSNNYLDLYGSQAMRGDLDLGGFKLSNVDDINTNLIWATGSITLDMKNITFARTFYIKNTLGAAAHLSVQNNISVGGTVDGVDLSGLKGDYDNLQTDVSNHFWRDTSNHVLEVNVGTRALKTDVSNHYALKTDVSNNYVTQFDVSNNYSPLTHNHDWTETYSWGQRNTDSGNSDWDYAGLTENYPNHRGPHMPASGSIIGMRGQHYWNSHTTDGNLVVKIWKNNSLTGIAISHALTSSDVGTYPSLAFEASNGTYTFEKGDMLVPYTYYEAGLAGTNRRGHLDIIVKFDDGQQWW